MLENLNPFFSPFLDKLKKHPKRILFTEGEDIRVIRVAEQIANFKLGVPILLGNKKKIEGLAFDSQISLSGIRLIEPQKHDEFSHFCSFLKEEKMQEMQMTEIEEMLLKPCYYGAMLLRSGAVDALVGGNQVYPSVLFRALLKMLPLRNDVSRVFSTVVSFLPSGHSLFSEGRTFFFSDCGFIDNPTSDELFSIALETARFSHHLLGREVHLALLSHSTKGSAFTPSSKKVAIATERLKLEAVEKNLLFTVEGEIQLDVAVCPDVADLKLPEGAYQKTPDVLIFPNLDSSHIAFKLMQHIAGAKSNGQVILGLLYPAAQVSRVADEESIFGAAILTATQSIAYQDLYSKE